MSAGHLHDRFDMRVRSLVSIHVLGDVLEFDGACRVAAEVVMHGIIESNNRAVAGAAHKAPMDPDAKRRACVARLAPPVLTGAVARLHLIGAMVAGVCFGGVRDKPYLDTDEIPDLVAIAYSLSLVLYARDPEHARRLLDT